MFDALIDAPPYSLPQAKKEAMMLQGVNRLIYHH